MAEQQDPPTPRQVHNGLIGIIGWIQLLQRRVRANRVDLEQVDTALTQLAILGRATERGFIALDHQRAQDVDAASLVAEIGYGQTVPVLSIQGDDGRVDYYYDVPAEVYQRLMSAASRDAFVATHIRGRYPSRRA